MSKKKTIGLGLGILAIAIVVAAVVFFRIKPMLESENNPRIISIVASVGENGAVLDYYILEEEISPQLNDSLLSLFSNAHIKRNLLPRPQSYEISDGSVYFTIHVSDGHSMLVNLSNISNYNSLQRGNTHYSIVAHEALYEDVSALLSDVLPDYVVTESASDLPSSN